MTVCTTLTAEELVLQVMNDPAATPRELAILSKLTAALDEVDALVAQVREAQGTVLKDTVHGGDA